jgi:DDE superfamily endonuclease
LPQEGAEIFFCDESGIRSDYHSGTTWAAVGQTPVVKSSGSRFSLNMVSAITAKGSPRFMVVEGRMNGERFLKRLIHNVGRPIFPRSFEKLQALVRSFFRAPDVAYAAL